jgi:hypothetical protein
MLYGPEITFNVSDKNQTIASGYEHGQENAVRPDGHHQNGYIRSTFEVR